MNINYHISPYPTLLENMVAKIYEASSPLAEVDSFTVVERDVNGDPDPGGGHQIPVSISFNGLDNVTHVVRLFTASATLLHEYDIQPTADTITVADPIYFQVGDGGTYTPTVDTATLTNPAFAGLVAADISIHQEGFGFLIPDVDFTLSGTTLLLLNGVFETGQRWYIFITNQVTTTPVNDSVVGKGFAGFVDVVGNVNYSSTDLRKLIRLSGTGNYTFPAGSYPVGYIHTFTNFGTVGSSPQVIFANATLLYGATPLSSIVIPFGSTFSVTFDGTNWNCILNDIKAGVSAPASNDIIGQGSQLIGDISATGPDTFVTITHGLALAYSYKVFGTLKGTTTSRLNDNNVCWSTYDYQSNYFKLGLQEFAGGIQDITFDYILVKV